MTLGGLVGGVSAEIIPAAVLERAKLSVLDLLGCGVAADARGLGVEGTTWAAAQGGNGARRLGDGTFAEISPRRPRRRTACSATPSTSTTPTRSR